MNTDIAIIISTAMVLIAPIFYIHSILYGKTRPHRTTRFVIAVISLLSTASLLSSNRSAAFWLASASALQATVVFAISLKRGLGGWSKLDLGSLSIAALGIVLWQTTNNPLFGLYASMAADFTGFIPTFIKTYRLPGTELWQYFAIDVGAGAISLAASKDLSAYTISYPIYIFMINAVMVVLILVRKKQLGLLFIK